MYSAIKWLAQNNHLYSQVEILEPTNLGEPSNKLLLPEKTLPLTTQELSILSNIKKSSQIEITHYSVIDLDKINENRPDIDKYSCKRITATPLPDRDINMDHYCHPTLYPYGTGGMFDKRLVEVIIDISILKFFFEKFSIKIKFLKVKPAMYIRWLIQHAIPIARRDQ